MCNLNLTHHCPLDLPLWRKLEIQLHLLEVCIKILKKKRNNNNLRIKIIQENFKMSIVYSLS